jgi:hypothetical protein
MSLPNITKVQSSKCIESTKVKFGVSKNANFSAGYYRVGKDFQSKCTYAIIVTASIANYLRICEQGTVVCYFTHKTIHRNHKIIVNIFVNNINVNNGFYVLMV